MNATGGSAPSQLLGLLFGPSNPQPGENLDAVLQHSWPAPAWVMLLIVILAATWVMAIYLRDARLASLPTKVGLVALRLALLWLVIFMMYGFVLRPFRMDVPDIVVLLDDSASMSHKDSPPDAAAQRELVQRITATGLSDTRRIDLAKTVLLESDAQLLRALDEHYQLKVATVSRPASIGWDTWSSLLTAVRTLPAEYSTSPLGDRLRNVLDAQRGRPTAAVVVLTDGITTEGITIADVAGYASRRAVPVYLVGLGNEQPEKDVQLSEVLVDDSVYVNDVVRFAVSVVANGFEGKEVQLRLRESGQPDVLAEARIRLGPDGQSRRVILQHRPPRVGAPEYVVEVGRMDGEAKSDNNAQRRTVTVSDETVRVLMVQAYPSYEFRFLKSLLSRSTSVDGARQQSPIDLTTVLQSADVEYAETDATARPGLPLDREELLDYDVILFGDVDPTRLSQSALHNIREFVTERGRGVAILCGPHHTPGAYGGTPLAPLFPIDLSTADAPSPSAPITQPFVVQLTQLGQISSHMQLTDQPSDNVRQWQELPGLYWFLRAPDVKPGVRVLAEHPDLTNDQGQKLPVICLHYVGAGKVMFHATDETWRWRLRRGDLVFGRYWIQTIRFLGRSKLGDSRDAKLATDRQRYRYGEPVRLRLRLLDDRQAPASDDGVTVMVQHEGRVSRRLQLRRNSIDRGNFDGTLSNLAAGEYSAWLVTPTLAQGAPRCEFSVIPPDNEMTQLQADLADLKRAADLSGGRFYTFRSKGHLIDDLPEGGQVRVEPLAAEPVWNSWTLAVVFVILLVSEWLLRKRAGLL